MTCKLCIRHGQDAKRGTKFYTATPSTSYREDAPRAHVKSDYHLVAVGLEAQREAAKNTGGIKAAMATQLTLQEFAFVSAMRCMYWLIKENIAFTTKYKSLISLVKDLVKHIPKCP